MEGEGVCLQHRITQSEDCRDWKLRETPRRGKNAWDIFVLLSNANLRMNLHVQYAGCKLEARK